MEGRSNTNVWAKQEIVTFGPDLIVKCALDYLPFVPGIYIVGVVVSVNNETLDCILNATTFEIENKGNFLYEGRNREHGYTQISCQFGVESV